MKKEFLDFLYEKRQLVIEQINSLVEKSKQNMAQCCDKMDTTNPYSKQIDASRLHLQTINQTINEYLNIHKNS